MVHAIHDRSKALADHGAEIIIGDLQEIDTIKQAMEGSGLTRGLKSYYHGQDN